MSITKMIRTLEKRHPGWKASFTGSTHIRWTHKQTGQFVFSSATPSDCRWERNLRMHMRHALWELKGNMQ